MFFDKIFNRKESLLSSGILCGATDCHSHILPGVDDGLESVEDSLAVLEYIEQQGVKELWCTPHIMEDVPNTTEALRGRFDALCAAYSGPLRLHLGAEYMMDALFSDRLQAGDLLPSYDGLLLLETYAANAFEPCLSLIRRTLDAGYGVLLAHPERYRYFGENELKRLRGMGVRFQLNIASLTSYYGEGPKARAEMLLDKGWYSCWGSDCHRLSTLRKQFERPCLNKFIVLKTKNI